MKTILDDILEIRHTQGGTMELDGIGTYHNNLRISSVRYDKVWRIKLNDGKKEGSLRVNRKPVYNYFYGDAGFKIQEIENGVPVSEWINVDVTIIMQD